MKKLYEEFEEMVKEQYVYNEKTHEIEHQEPYAKTHPEFADKLKIIQTTPREKIPDELKKYDDKLKQKREKERVA